MIRIPFLNKKTAEIKRYEEENDDPEDPNIKYRYKPFTRAVNDLKPGEIIQLTYMGSGNKTVLITATERGPLGNFISTRNNNLLCCFELNEESFMFKLVLKLFHKKQNRCEYKLMPSFLKYVFGLSAFKTLDISKISSVYLLIKKQ
jgi:hypothetical protein